MNTAPDLHPTCIIMDNLPFFHQLQCEPLLGIRKAQFVHNQDKEQLRCLLSTMERNARENTQKQDFVKAMNAKVYDIDITTGIKKIINFPIA